MHLPTFFQFLKLPQEVHFKVFDINWFLRILTVILKDCHRLRLIHTDLIWRGKRNILSRKIGVYFGLSSYF